MEYVEQLSAGLIRLLRDELWHAAEEGRVRDVSRLSTHFTGDVGTLSEALYRSRRSGQLNVVTWLVEYTVLRDNGECLGYALVMACIGRQWNIVRWLVNNIQLDVNYADEDSINSILHYVISFNTTNLLLQSTSNMTELCRLVYVCDEDINVQDDYDEYTPLHTACYNNNSDTVGALLLAGSDETITNGWGKHLYNLL